MAAAAVLVVGASVAVAQMVVDQPLVVPTSDRFVIASGETAAGPWRLSAYQATDTVPAPPGDPTGPKVLRVWCLDLDQPGTEAEGKSGWSI